MSGLCVSRCAIDKDSSCQNFPPGLTSKNMNDSQYASFKHCLTGSSFCFQSKANCEVPDDNCTDPKTCNGIWHPDAPPPPPKPKKFFCDQGHCTQGTGPGGYDTQAECEKACTPPPPKQLWCNNQHLDVSTGIFVNDCKLQNATCDTCVYTAPGSSGCWADKEKCMSSQPGTSDAGDWCC
jgi:hypothetical protein